MSQGQRTRGKLASREKRLGNKLQDIKALAFDFDGTIVDSVDYLVRTWHDAAKSVGIEVDVDLKPLIGMTGPEILKLISGGNMGLAERIMSMRRELFDAKRFVKNVRVFPDVVPALICLRKRGYGLALAGSTASERLKERASALGVDELFDIIVGGDEVKGSKPAPDLIMEAANRLGIAVESMVYIGDTSYDVEAAHKAGAIAILVLRHGQKYTGPAADITVKSLSRLLDLLPNHVCRISRA